MTEVLVVAEHRRGELRADSLEAITAAAELAEDVGGELGVVVIGGDVDAYADSLDRQGVDVIYTVDYGEEFNHDVTVQVLDQLWADLEPMYLVASSSVNAMDYVPAFAQRHDVALVPDARAISTSGRLTVTRRMYGGKVETDVAVGDERAAITVLDGEWPPAGGTGAARIEPVEVEIDEDDLRTAVTGFQEVGAGDVDISEADFIVSVGRGIEEEENLELIERLVEVTGATLAASRPIVDNDWLPQDRQVGQSGKTVTPTIYVAIGISGAVQHVAGMKGAETVIAINEDPDAPIFDVADYGIVDDLFEVVPALIEAFGGEPP